jgi:flagellar motility protein MotE (MotC chaperone)
VPARPAPAAEPSAAERALLEALRGRRLELEAREAALSEREVLLAAAERRLSQRVEEMQALQQRLEAENRARAEQNEQGMRQLVRLYEGMRPRDAATIFDDLEMAVLIPVLDRMREARAAPVLAAMRPERARVATTELARHRARPTD